MECHRFEREDHPVTGTVHGRGYCRNRIKVERDKDDPCGKDQNSPGTPAESDIHIAQKLVQVERRELGQLVSEEVQLPKKRKACDGEDEGDAHHPQATHQSNLEWMLARDKELPKLLHVFKRLSNRMLERCREEGVPGGKLSAIARKDSPNTPKSCKPSPFTLVPLCKLKPAHVLYTNKEMAVFFQYFTNSVAKKETTRPQPMQNRVPVLEKKQDVKNPKQYVSVLRFAEHVFDMRLLRKREELWTLNCFRTNGTQVEFTFVSGSIPAAPNSACLIEAGYDIPLPSQGINALGAIRGLHVVQEGRNDLTPIDGRARSSP